MGSWLGQAVRRGIQTTRYPREPSTAAESPVSSRSPRPASGTEISAAAVASCPVSALAARAVDDGQCIRCARCLAHGLEFTGPVEAAARDRAALVRTTGAFAPASEAPPPLASLGRSIHVFMVDVGSCNACNLEVLALANPLYDLQRLGVFFTNSPRHADVLLVVGVPTPEMVDPLRRAYAALPDPKAVMAVGVCAIGGGAFAGTAGLAGTLSDLVPVDLFVPGCPPTPLNILDGLLALTGRDRRRREG